MAIRVKAKKKRFLLFTFVLVDRVPLFVIAVFPS